MMKKSAFLILALIILTAATGCAQECTAEEILTFTPILQSPADGALVSYENPGVFEWTHQESCIPSSYIITYAWGEVSLDNGNFQDGDTTHFLRDTPLLPGTSYEWYVTAVHTEEVGEIGFNNTLGPPSETWTFTTDGMCSGSDLEPPVPSSPPTGWINNGSGPDYVNIEWSYPGDCYPEGYHYQIASDPDFKNIITSGITDWNEQSALIHLPKCAKIYWRVEARAGNASGGYSNPSYFTHSSITNCFLLQESVDAALLKGFVFADYCKSTVPWVPDGVGIFPPCTFGEPYGVHADGNRNRVATEQEVTGEEIPVEIGIPDVVVDLGAGPCPSTGLDQMNTLQNGAYYFMVQSPGEYCLSISKDNNPSLDHGIWTRPLTDQPIAEYTLDFEEGDDLMLVDFGWDQNDFLKIDFDVELLSFCRLRDSKNSPEVAILEEGIKIPIIARNEDATWFAALVDGKRCFISIASGSPQEDPSDLMIYPTQLTTQAGPETQSCSDFKTPESCQDQGCKWIYTAAAGICTDP